MTYGHVFDGGYRCIHCGVNGNNAIEEPCSRGEPDEAAPAHCTDGPAYIEGRDPHYPGPRGHEKITVVSSPETPAPSEVVDAVRQIIRDAFRSGWGQAALLTHPVDPAERQYREDLFVGECAVEDIAKRLASPSGAAAPQSEPSFSEALKALREAAGDLGEDAYEEVMRARRGPQSERDALDAIASREHADSCGLVTSDGEKPCNCHVSIARRALRRDLDGEGV